MSSKRTYLYINVAKYTIVRLHEDSRNKNIIAWYYGKYNILPTSIVFL